MSNCIHASGSGFHQELRCPVNFLVPLCQLQVNSEGFSAYVVPCRTLIGSHRIVRKLLFNSALPFLSLTLCVEFHALRRQGG